MYLPPIQHILFGGYLVRFSCVSAFRQSLPMHPPPSLTQYSTVPRFLPLFFAFIRAVLSPYRSDWRRVKTQISASLLYKPAGRHFICPLDYPCPCYACIEFPRHNSYIFVGLCLPWAGGANRTRVLTLTRSPTTLHRHIKSTCYIIWCIPPITLSRSPIR